MGPAKKSLALSKLPSRNERKSAKPTEANRIRSTMSRPACGSSSIKKTVSLNPFCSKLVHPNYITRPLDASTNCHLINPPRKSRSGSGRIEKDTKAHRSYSIMARQNERLSTFARAPNDFATHRTTNGAASSSIGTPANRAFSPTERQTTDLDLMRKFGANVQILTKPFRIRPSGSRSAFGLSRKKRQRQ